jgi:penicillin-binding protein 1A
VAAHEDTGKFYGPIRLRDALVHSRNLVSVRLMRAIGGEYTRDYVTRFGFDKSQLPDDLTLALGTAELSPLQVAIGYSTFANGGFKVSSYYIDRVEDANGKMLSRPIRRSPASQCGVPATADAPKARRRRPVPAHCSTRPRTTARP